MTGAEIVHVDLQAEFAQAVHPGQQAALGLGGALGQFQRDLFRAHAFPGHLAHGEIDETGVGDVLAGDVDADVEAPLFLSNGPSCFRARRKTKRVSSSMSPLSSRAPMKTSGETRPRLLSVQRARASTPAQRPLARRTMGW